MTTEYLVPTMRLSLRGYLATFGTYLATGVFFFLIGLTALHLLSRSPVRFMHQRRIERVEGDLAHGFLPPASCARAVPTSWDATFRRGVRRPRNARRRTLNAAHRWHRVGRRSRCGWQPSPPPLTARVSRVS